MATVKFTREEKLNIIFLAMCDGGHSPINIGLSKEQYAKARATAKPFEEGTLCVEDVWMHYLITNESMIFEDLYDVDAIERTLDEILESMDNLPTDVAVNFINESYDGDDADAVLQTIVFNEIIYG